MMQKSGATAEIEIKLRVPSLAAVRGRLRKLHATQISPRTHESNTLYDTPEQKLRRRGQLVRLRIERRASNSSKGQNGDKGRAILTYKAPFRSAGQLQGLGRGVKQRGRFKIRDEAETTVADAEPIDRILRALGLRPMFRYEKFRTTYRFPGLPGVKIELDETPIGDYLELEGNPSGIHRAARLLGYTRTDYITSTYGTLYLAECRRRGTKPADGRGLYLQPAQNMTFASKKLR